MTHRGSECECAIRGARGADVQLVAVQYLDVAAQQGFVLARVGAREQNAMGAKDQCVISGATMACMMSVISLY